MKIDINDPRLTQYALGEMAPDEIEAFEDEIKDNQEILDEIEEIREFSSKLDEGLSGAPELSLSEARQEQIKENAGKVDEKPINRTINKPLLIKVILTSAAMLFLTTLVFHEEIIKRIKGPGQASKKKDYDITVDMTTIKPPNIPPMPDIPDPPESVIAFDPIGFETPELEMDSTVTIEDISIANPKEIALPNIIEIGPTNPAFAKKHDRYRNVLFVDGCVKGYEGSSWSEVSEVAILRDFDGDGMITMAERQILPQNTWLKLTEQGFIEDGRIILCPTTVAKDSKKQYPQIVENHFLKAQTNPLSTFSIDINSTSYENIKRFLNHGLLPPPNSVKIEEMVNYFSYDYPRPETGKPFSVNFEVASCPWQPKHRLVKIGIKGKDISQNKRPASNLVFLLDVSGSMKERGKLPLLKDSMKLLVENLNRNDRIAIVVYSASSGLALPSTTADNKEKIMTAFEHLKGDGSTNAKSAIELAYKTAAENFIEGGTNRVIVATDEDFIVDDKDESSIEEMVQEKAKNGVFLSVLGFGKNDEKHKKIEKLSERGNGHYAYIDSLKVAKKVLVNETGAKLTTIARDTKVQVEFNPELVEGYRLIGYENQTLKKEYIKNDKKDSGEIGSGHTVTAFYEVVPKGGQIPKPKVALLDYKRPTSLLNSKTDFSNELLKVKLSYKGLSEEQKSKLLEFPLKNRFKPFASASYNFKFAASVVAFGMILRNSQYKGTSTYEAVLYSAEDGMKKDKYGYRKEFLSLIKKAQKLNAINKE